MKKNVRTALGRYSDGERILRIRHNNGDRLEKCVMRTWYHIEQLRKKDNAENGHEEDA